MITAKMLGRAADAAANRRATNSVLAIFQNSTPHALPTLSNDTALPLKHRNSSRGLLLVFGSGFLLGTVAGFFLQKQWRAFNQYRADRAKAQYLLAKQRLDEA
eukprot:m.87098 g.87098  ORF g.87098 m.87098 type:complete len:103 (+) comp13577_c0_seq6:1539-1847(+)